MTSGQPRYHFLCNHSENWREILLKQLIVWPKTTKLRGIGQRAKQWRKDLGHPALLTLYVSLIQTIDSGSHLLKKNTLQYRSMKIHEEKKSVYSSPKYRILLRIA